MSYEIRADYGERYLFPPSLEEWVGEDHPARFIREFVDALEMEELGFSVRRSREGRPNYAGDLLLKVWLYGYMSRIYSTRGLERACREHVSLLWLTGMHAPDHNTLWRFWRDNKAGLREVFKRAVSLALEWDMVGMVLHAVDGTKIAADVSKGGAWHREDLKKLLERLDGVVEDAESEVEGAQERELGEYRLPEKLQDAQRLREAIREALRELERVNRDHLHPRDGDARMMRCEGKVVFAYNAQAVVDAESGLVVAQEVVNEESDKGQLTGMLEEVEQVAGKTAERTVADAGYSSGEQLTRAEARGYEVVVNLGEAVNPSGNDKEFHASKFAYDAEKDCCVCPRGEELSFERTKRGRHKRYRVRVYRCHRWRSCAVRWQCSRDKRGRTIEISPYHEAVVRERVKQREPRNREALEKRKVIVEPVFGVIKHVRGFRRWTVRGLEGVRTQWSLLCTAHNLLKLRRKWGAGKQVPV